MPRRIRQRRRGRGLRKRGAMRKGLRMATVPRGLVGRGVHSFTEKVQLPSIGVPPGISYGVITYQINQLINWNSYAALFDLYKLKAVKLTLIGLANTSEVMLNNGVLQSGALPMLYLAPNRDPYVPAPLSIPDVINDDGCKIIRFSRPASFYLSNPKPNVVDNTGDQLPFQFNVRQQPWLTTGGNAQTIDQSAVKHYGHRYAIANSASVETVVQVYAKFYFEMKEQD